MGINHFNDPKAFIEYSNDVRDVYKNTDEYNLGKDNKNLIVFDDMIADMINNKKINSIVPKLFIRGTNLNIFLVFVTQSNFKVLKSVRLNTTHFCITKIANKTEIRDIATNHSSDIKTEDFILKISIVLLNHICSLLMILRLNQIIL